MLKILVYSAGIALLFVASLMLANNENKDPRYTYKCDAVYTVKAVEDITSSTVPKSLGNCTKVDYGPV